MGDLVGEVFFLDEFAQRQWDDPQYSGTTLSFDKAEFVKRIESLHSSGEAPLVDGYAPFCKHVFVPNFVGARLSVLKITEENEPLLRSGYSARTPAELPVLTRWFPMSSVGEPPESSMLDVILYSREQLEKERSAMSSKQERAPLPQAPWGIISVKAQDQPFELPMQPITVMRNSLGREEGGSGVPLDREKYMASVDYWKEHAPIIKASSPNGE
eukprot:CAMPEP_0196590790 /NCGR_PEP_ID=MMETSP1081-20130531/67569_1 /TAXON_ID=36882 /ORGANISM="Pyramimonas amylifera, Strain CCMP720" /LENGTH=213 /DNA_ID=CAMNT_0041913989 /DNA_START=309 /DNA_END=950 /DNA_ORIENTATION=+